MPPKPRPSQRRVSMTFLQRPMEKLFGGRRSGDSDQESSEGEEVPDWARRAVLLTPEKSEKMEHTTSRKPWARQPRKPGLMGPSSSWRKAAGAAEVTARRALGLPNHGRGAAWMEEQLQQLQKLCKLQEAQIGRLRSDLTALQRQLAAQAEASRAELEGVCGLRADVAEMRAVGGLLDHCKEEDERRRERFERLYARAEEQVRQLQARVKELAPLPAQTEDQVQQLEVRVQATCETADLDLGSRQEERWRPRASRFAGSTALEHQDAPGQRSADSSPAPVGATAPPAEGFLLPPGALMARCSARDLPAGHQPQRSPRPPPKMQA
uniref:Uncharacterized protein n=1 Tax=Alexandrium monilatum TaxID=311494 RepID=A0A6T0YQZ8_9DINO